LNRKRWKKPRSRLNRGAKTSGVKSSPAEKGWTYIGRGRTSDLQPVGRGKRVTFSSDQMKVGYRVGGGKIYTVPTGRENRVKRIQHKLVGGKRGNLSSRAKEPSKRFKKKKSSSFPKRDEGSDLRPKGGGKGRCCRREK